MSSQFWVETLGCPKNRVDSDKLTGTLLADGLVPADHPEDADVVVVNTCAFIGEARQESIDTILELAPEVVVPGHGPPCGLDGVRELRAYFCFVREEARDGFAAGRTVLDAAKRIDLGPYADWNQPERLVFSVARIYRELRGEAWDEPVDAMALLDETHALREHLRQR